MTSISARKLVILLLIVLSAVRAEGLPPAPTELGEIRRNAQGQLEVVRRLPPQNVAGKDDEPVTAAERSSSPSAGSMGRTLVVGPSQPIKHLKEAARLARDGDTIEVMPGEYRQQAVVWMQNRLTIRGKGGRPAVIGEGDSAEGKALWVVRSREMVIENIEFRGARVPDGNGAGIRFEKGRLKVVHCTFFDNEMGILTGNDPETVLEIEDSEFGAAPRHSSGALHHLLYAGTIARLSVIGSRFQDGFRGHLIKSRARESVIAYNMIVDGPNGSASYELEFPNGGLAWVTGNVIGQSAGTDNPDIVSYGAEGRRWDENALFLIHNTLVNERVDGRFLRIWSERLPPTTEVWAINNLTVGYGTFSPQAAGRFDGNVGAADRRVLVDVEHLDFRLPSNSPLRGQARLPGWAHGRDLRPVAEFMLPVGTRPLIAGKPLTAGALQ